MTAVLRLRSCARRLPLTTGSVHAVVTSPPYYGLRAYNGVPATVWGGDPDHAHEWGALLPAIQRGQVPQTKWAGVTAVADGQRAATGALCACGAWRGTLGNEPTVDLYVAHMVECFREVRRVLRDDGVCWLNLGDSFAAGSRTTYDDDNKAPEARGGDFRAPSGIPAGNLLGVPWRVALALQADGWLLRNDLIWAKAAPMPESVSGVRWERHRIKIARGEVGRDGLNGSGQRPHGASISEPQRLGAWPDRPNQEHDGPNFAPRAEWSDCPGCDKCAATDGMVLRRGAWRHTRAHEYVFMLAKGPGYFCDGDAVKEAASAESLARYGRNRSAGHKWDGVDPTGHDAPQTFNDPAAFRAFGTRMIASAGRNPRSVMHLGPEPLADAHFAAFPTALVEPLIASSTSARGVCRACGAPWARVVELRRGGPTGRDSRRATPDGAEGNHNSMGRVEGSDTRGLPSVESRTLGWRPTCTCAAGDPIPATVLDPFAGSGTTGAVAVRLGRRAILCDLSATYLRDIAGRRTRVQPPLAGEWFA